MIMQPRVLEQKLSRRGQSFVLSVCFGAILFALSSFACFRRTKSAQRISNCARPERKPTTFCGRCRRVATTCDWASTWSSHPGTTNVTPPRTLFANDASTERWSIKRPGGLTGDEIHIAGLAATMTDVLVRIENLDGTTQVTRVTPSSPSFVVAAAPGALEVCRTYLVLGVEHILFGVDHLLFVLALLILVKGWRKLVGTITAFTVAHSITLAAATLGFVHVPSKPVEATIALSIVFVACEIVHRRQGRSGLTETWPWVIAFSFGLLHGLGFANALREVGLPQNAIPLALLFFNIGVELGQLLFIGFVMAVIAVAVYTARKFSRSKVTPQFAFAWCENISAYAIGGVAAFWLIERTLSFVV